MIMFAYDFPHRKTEDFIIYCSINNIKIDYIIAAKWKNLRFKKLPFKTKLNIRPKFHPKEIAAKFNIPYLVMNHNSNECIDFLSNIKPYIGIIAGARILPSKVINKFSIGIINLHPGDIPEVRGLNSSLRAIKNNKSQVVTSHLIDNKIDSGIILFKKEIDLSENDSIFDINEKLYHTQFTMIQDSIDIAFNGQGEVINKTGKYFHSIPFDNVEDFELALKNYLSR